MVSNSDVCPDAIARTERAIRSFIRRTPLLHDGDLTLKLEGLQHSGSFKARGAFANLVGRPIPKAGVVAASGGNHGAAVAYAAMALEIPAVIFVPFVSSPAKIDRIKAYGARVVVGGAGYTEAYEASLAYVNLTGALAIHAFDSIETILGQGTLAKEFDEDAPDIDTLLVGVGGAGLIAGIVGWYEHRIKIVGVEPFWAPTLQYALAAGSPVDAPVGSVAIDSLAPRRVGALPFAVIQQSISDVVLVEDTEIIAAQAALWERYRLVGEPGGSAAYAAFLSRAYKASKGERIGIVVSGANAVVSWN
jgi:threonine dehydratase